MVIPMINYDILVYVGESEAVIKLLDIASLKHVVAVTNGYLKDLSMGQSIRLSNDISSDVLAILEYLSRLDGALKFVIDGVNNYLAILAYIVASILHDRVVEAVVSYGGDVAHLNPALTYALGHGKAFNLRMKILKILQSKCVDIAKLAKQLGISRETLLKHLYSLSKSKLIKIRGSNVCTNK